jgi:predicted Zn-dependent protease
MKIFYLTLIAICSFFVVSAQEKTDKIKELEQRIRQLEERVSKLEEKSAMTQPTPAAQKMMKVARQHVKAEQEQFGSTELIRAEALYQKGAQLYQSNNTDSKKMLDSVVAEFPLLNRAGCAQLYRAQQEDGAKHEQLLKDCITRFYNCYYLDGAQVGSLALFQLASYYKNANRNDEAQMLFKKLRDQHPEAVGHDGALLINKIE